MDRLWEGLETGDIDIGEDNGKDKTDILIDKVEEAYRQSVYNRRDILLLHRVIVKLVEQDIVSKETIVDMKRQVTDEVKEEHPEVFSSDSSQ